MDTYYDHTDSHWQTPAKNITYLKKVVIPDKDANIARLKLAVDQKAIFIHALHYSNKDATVLEFTKDNNLLSLYIPAGCADVMQTCDTMASHSRSDLKPLFEPLFKITFTSNMTYGRPNFLIKRAEDDSTPNLLWGL